MFSKTRLPATGGKEFVVHDVFTKTGQPDMVLSITMTEPTSWALEPPLLILKAVVQFEMVRPW
jgi:hypothetical protein